LFGEAKPTKVPHGNGISIPPLWPGTYRGYGRPVSHVLNEINNMLGMISQQRSDITTSLQNINKRRSMTASPIDFGI